MMLGEDVVGGGKEGLEAGGRECLIKITMQITQWAQGSQAGAHVELTLLLSSVHGTRRHFAHHQEI